ncbi:caffeoylshikimate esterase-like [Tripterygium wilfordii]|uniref:Caffeoylshikimate esterase-like n=1 Tax=Tripterygium wilfordii TaxID=458696 RepID=A0A7J7CIC7_TRIWF|nr:caffeoylshikimate esterase-like [Tripterygium wilfordii]
MTMQEHILNPRGLKLFTCKWIPMNQEPKALIFICHGYAMECSVTMHSTAMRLAKAGFAVHGIDYEGHGKSAGLQGFVNRMEDVVTDCVDYFSSIAADVKPGPVMQNILIKLCRIIPTWEIIATKDVVNLAFKVHSIREEIRANPYCYKWRPRLKTGYELLKISIELERNLDKISAPFIVLHGEDDRLTDKAVSKQLFDVSASTDKSFKLYPEMWHGLLYGEPLENI